LAGGTEAGQGEIDKKNAPEKEGREPGPKEQRLHASPCTTPAANERPNSLIIGGAGRRFPRSMARMRFSPGCSRRRRGFAGESPPYKGERPAMALSDAASRIPVTVLTGFLGSGKTTLLNHVLKQPEMAATAVIVNEFGEIGLDHLLVESATEDVVLLNSGCLCCTVRGDIVNTLTDLFVNRVKGRVPYFTRAVIETTGLADPAPV